MHPVDIENVIIEVNSLRLSENKTIVECMQAFTPVLLEEIKKFENQPAS